MDCEVSQRMFNRVLAAVAVVFLSFGLSQGEADRLATSLEALQEQLPAGVFPAVARTLQGDNADAYRVVAGRAGESVVYRAENAAHGMATEFAPDGVRVAVRKGSAWSWGMALSGYGRRGAVQPVSAAQLRADGIRVDYAYDEGIAAWYVNGRLGLQQGFTLSRRPAGASGAGEVEVRLSLTGVAAQVDAGGRAATLRQLGGPGHQRYAGLYVYDAAGRELPARLASSAAGLSVLVDDREAQYPVVIDPFIQRGKTAAADGAAYDYFGESVSVSGDTLVVGAGGHEVNGVAGSAYVFVKPSGGVWAGATQVAKLTASDGAAGDEFGFSVSISGDTIVIGAWRDDDTVTDSGSAYVFVRPSGGWRNATQTAKLSAADVDATDPWSGSGFGRSVSVSGGTIVVGALWNDDAKGAAYVFEKPSGGWQDATQTAKLTAPDGSDGDLFGHSVSVSGDTIVVGAHADEPHGTFSGSAYVFEKPSQGWVDATAAAKLRASDGAAWDIFGHSVSVSGDTIVVGAPWDGANGFHSGAAYVFVRPSSGWVGHLLERGKLVADDGAAWDEFGYSVSVSGDTIVVGASGDDDKGSAYVFAEPSGGWFYASQTEQTDKLTAADGSSLDDFGRSVSVSGGAIVVGAPWKDDNGTDSGAAYIYDYEEPIPGKLTASDGAAGDELGWSVSVSGDTIVVGAPGDDAGRGAAYVFVRPGGGAWADATQQARLTFSHGDADDDFGTSVSAAGDLIVVGAPAAVENPYHHPHPATGAAYVFEKPAGGWVNASETIALLADDGAAGDEFGHSVSVSGDTIVVGAPGDGSAGSAYVFVRPRRGWGTRGAGTAYFSTRHDAKLTASDGAANEDFGTSVSVSGDTIVVGAPGHDRVAPNLLYDTGLAYVFVSSGMGWVDATETARLAAADAAAEDYFGASVSVSGDTVAVGAFGDDDNGAGSGSAYVFAAPIGGWSGTATQAAKLTADDGAAADAFGYAVSVSVSGDTMVVGSPGHAGTGAAYVFMKPAGGWVNATQTDKLTAADGAANDDFGHAVSVSGDGVVVGAPGGDALGTDAGAVYVYPNDEPAPAILMPVQQVEVTASSAGSGYAVSVSGDTLALGAPYEDMSHQDRVVNLSDECVCLLPFGIILQGEDMFV